VERQSPNPAPALRDLHNPAFPIVSILHKPTDDLEGEFASRNVVREILCPPLVIELAVVEVTQTKQVPGHPLLRAGKSTPAALRSAVVASVLCGPIVSRRAVAGVAEGDGALRVVQVLVRRTPLRLLRRMLASVALRTSIASRRGSVPLNSSRSDVQRKAPGSFRRWRNGRPPSPACTSQHTAVD
jgi:hypothetical protein